ncbi:MAG: hypothetical protein M3347_13880, partial [Armatimonadota bacterium]|nr:hypothetical protein [Armatimonadota bacterium]
GLGGAIFNNQNGTVTMTNSTISGNSASGGNGGSGAGTTGGGGFGGGVFNRNGTVTVKHCTFSNNSIAAGTGGTPGVAGGGFYNLQQTGGTATVNLTNTIIANSTGGNDAENNGGTVTGPTANRNLIESHSGFGTPFSTANPNLAALAFNGGPTPTHALQTGSPALDQGIAIAGLTTDQRGLTRPVDFPGIANSLGGNGSDLGAYEAQATDLGGTLQFSATNYSVGESGPVATITVQRIGGSTGTVTVRYATGDGSAKQPGDYTASTGVLTWGNGDTTDRTFTVPIIDDSIDEANETVNLALVSPSGAVLLGTQKTAVLTILDNDAPPNISIGDATPVPLLEGNSGTTTLAHFNVSLSQPSGQTVTVRYATAPGTVNPANGQDAPNSGDFQNRRDVLIFPPGVTSQDLTITVNGDNLDEANETFFVNLSSPVNAGISDNRGVGTITDDDAPPRLSISDAAPVFEGDSGSTMAQFTVTLSEPSGQQVKVIYGTINGTATGSATPGAGDYLTQSGSLIFTPGGAPSQTVVIPVYGDTIGEGNETFFVKLSNPTNATIDVAQGQCTILDDDSAPDLLIKKDSEPDSAFALNNVYQSTPTGAQTELQTAAPNVPAVYQTLIQNDSARSTTFVLKATEAGATGFVITYKIVDFDISGAIQGTGYTTPNLPPGGTLPITITATPTFAPSGTFHDSFLRVFRDNTDVTVRDSVLARTTVQPTADLLIKLNSEPVSAFQIDNVYQTTPAGGQARVQSTAPAATLVYLVKVQNDSSTTRSFVVKGTGATDSSWFVKYRSGATDITSAILGAGYTTVTLAPTASEILAVEVTPRSGTTSGSFKDVLLKVFLNGGDTTVRDAVSARTSVP